MGGTLPKVFWGGGKKEAIKESKLKRNFFKSPLMNLSLKVDNFKVLRLF